MSKLPKALTSSEAYHDDPAEATELWTAGFRPMEARTLKPGMSVVYRETDVFQLDTVGSWASTLIGDVLDDERGTITCSTFDRGNVEVDECTEVWAKAPEPLCTSCGIEPIGKGRALQNVGLCHYCYEERLGL